MDGMKKIIIFLILSFSINSFAGTLNIPSLSQTKTEGVEVVEKVMDNLMAYLSLETSDRYNRDKYKTAIIGQFSEKYFRDAGIDKDMLKINYYMPEGYRIVIIDPGFIKVKLYSNTYGWKKYISIKLVDENGCLLIRPSKIYKNYIYWWTDTK